MLYASFVFAFFLLVYITYTLTLLFLIEDTRASCVTDFHTGQSLL